MTKSVELGVLSMKGSIVSAICHGIGESNADAIDPGVACRGSIEVGAGVMCCGISSMGGVVFTLIGFDVGPTLSLKFPTTGEDCILLADTDRDSEGEKWLLDSDKGDSMVGILIPCWRI